MTHQADEPTTGAWLVPLEVELFPDGESLVWHIPEAKGLGEVKAKHARPGLLGQFVRLAGAEPDAILRFARTWGPLSPNLQEYPTLLQEPLSLWRNYAAGLRALLALYERLSHGECGREEDWLAVARISDVVPTAWARQRRSASVVAHPLTERDLEELERLEAGASWPASASVDAVPPVEVEPPTRRVFAPPWLPAEDQEKGQRCFERGLFCKVLHDLEEKTGVRIEWAWHKSFLQLRRFGMGLAAELVLQLTQYMAGGLVEFCSVCGRPYTPRRRSSVGRRQFCPECRKTKAPAIRQREYRRRKAVCRRKGGPDGTSPRTR
jgi:hypothetical protein